MDALAITSTMDWFERHSSITPSPRVAASVIASLTPTPSDRMRTLSRWVMSLLASSVSLGSKSASLRWSRIRSAIEPALVPLCDGLALERDASRSMIRRERNARGPVRCFQVRQTSSAALACARDPLSAWSIAWSTAARMN